MRTLIFIVALLPGLAVAAEQPKKKKGPSTQPVAGNPCAHHGEGWVQVQGSNTCVKLSGSIRIDMGRNVGR